MSGISVGSLIFFFSTLPLGIMSLKKGLTRFNKESQRAKEFIKMGLLLLSVSLLALIIGICPLILK